MCMCVCEREREGETERERKRERERETVKIYSVLHYSLVSYYLSFGDKFVNLKS